MAAQEAARLELLAAEAAGVDGEWLATWADDDGWGVGGQTQVRGMSQGESVTITV